MSSQDKSKLIPMEMRSNTSPDSSIAPRRTNSNIVSRQSISAMADSTDIERRASDVIEITRRASSVSQIRKAGDSRLLG